MAAERAGFGGKLRRVLGRGKDELAAAAEIQPVPAVATSGPQAARRREPSQREQGYEGQPDRVAPARQSAGSKANPAASAAARPAKTAAPSAQRGTKSAPATTRAVPTPTNDTAKSAPAKGAPAKGAPAKGAPAKGAPAKGAPAKSAPAKRAPAKSSGGTTGRRAARPTAVHAPQPSQEHTIDAPAPEPTAAKAPAKARKAPAKKPAVAATAADTWTEVELAGVRGELEGQAKDLRGEIDEAESQSNEIQQAASNEGSGDEADAGTKTFEREHEMSLANNSRDLLLQVERALARLYAGTYGRCENCGNPIPKPRLQAFPRATMCVSCKQREERR